MSGLTVNPNERDPLRQNVVMRQLAEGRSNNVGTFTVTQNAATTTVTAPTCSSGSTIILFPTTANGAAEVGNGTIYVSTVSNGSFVVTHANSATASRTFMWAAIG